MESPLDGIAQAAADLGPGIEPPGYRDLLEEITTTCRELTGAAACSVAVLDLSTEELEFVAASGAGADAIVGTRMDAHKGIAGWAVASGQALTVGKAADDPRFARDVAEATGYIPRSIFAIPLETDRGVVGVLEILDADAEAPASAGVMDDRSLSAVVAILARHAAIAIETSALFEDLGSVMLRAAGGAAAERNAEGDEALHQALMDVAARTSGPRRELGSLLSIFYELGRLGPNERTLATRMLKDLLTYTMGERSS